LSADVRAEPSTGAAHVATVSFLAARATPTGGFWIALAGGVALARAALRGSARSGYGASMAAMLETVAIMGPARFSVPLTQALSAPMLGRQHARGHGPVTQFLACAAIRVASNLAATAFFIWIVTGGLDAYSGAYERLGELVGLGLTTTVTLAVTAAGLIGWGAFASVVQVGVYRRGLERWPEDADEAEQPTPATPPAPRPAASRRQRFDPRAVAVAAAIAFGLLLASTEWTVIGAVTAWMALAWATARGERTGVSAGLALAAFLAFGALVFTLVGGLGVDLALRRACRAGLLVVAATWLRAAAGADGVREVARRTLTRLSRVPSVPEAAAVLDGLGSEQRLLAAGRALLARLSDVPKKPVPVLDAVLAWVSRESRAYDAAGAPAPAAPLSLRMRPRDALLVTLATAPLSALLL
jgi:hypothetical protein